MVAVEARLGEQGCEVGVVDVGQDDVLLDGEAHLYIYICICIYIHTSIDIYTQKTFCSTVRRTSPPAYLSARSAIWRA